MFSIVNTEESSVNGHRSTTVDVYSGQYQAEGDVRSCADSEVHSMALNHGWTKPVLTDVRSRRTQHGYVSSFTYSAEKVGSYEQP